MLKGRWTAWACLGWALLPALAWAHGEASSFELGPMFSASLGETGQGRWGSFRLPARYFVFDGADLGLEARYWPGGSYPLYRDAGGVAAAGADGRIFFVNRAHFGAYVGGALLWAPAHTQLVLSPEVGARYFVTSRLALTVTYDIVTDLGSFLLSVQPTPDSGSTQSLGAGIAIEL